MSSRVAVMQSKMLNAQRAAISANNSANACRVRLDEYVIALNNANTEIESLRKRNSELENSLNNKEQVIFELREGLEFLSCLAMLLVSIVYKVDRKNNFGIVFNEEGMLSLNKSMYSDCGRKSVSEIMDKSHNDISKHITDEYKSLFNKDYLSGKDSYFRRIIEGWKRKS